MKLLFVPRLLLTGFMAICLLSCKKSEEHAADYYVTFKNNDTWVTWNNALGEIGKDLADDSKINLGVSAHNEDFSEVLDLTIQAGKEALSPGVYHSDDHFTQIVYTDHFGDRDGGLYTMEAPGSGPHSNYTIHITDITPSTVRGRFSGNFLTGKAGSEIRTTAITEGEFFVRRIR